MQMEAAQARAAKKNPHVKKSDREGSRNQTLDDIGDGKVSRHAKLNTRVGKKTIYCLLNRDSAFIPINNSFFLFKLPPL